MPPRLRKNENKPHIPAIPFEKCAAKTTTDGKPGTTVLDHGIHVGRVADGDKSIAEALLVGGGQRREDIGILLDAVVDGAATGDGDAGCDK